MVKLEKLFLPLLLATAGIAGAASLFIGLQQSVWFDEAYSILLAEHSWSEIVRLTAEDVHPPMYYWLLKTWMMLFGASELALRSMGTLCLGASIVVTGLLLRKFFGSKVALIALPFLVFAPFLLRYGFEIRMYSFVSMLGVAATYLLVLAVEEPEKKKRWLLFLAYALLVALGVYSLYFMALLWIAHFVWLLWMSYSQRRRGTAILGLLAYMFAFLLFLPWLPVFLDSASGTSLSSVTGKLGLENLFGVMMFLFLYQPSWNMNVLTVTIVIFILITTAYLTVHVYRNTSKRERRYLLLLGMYFFIPVAVLVIVTHFKPIYLERYVAHIALGAYAGIGAVVGLALRSKSMPPKIMSGLLAVVLVIGSVSLAQYGNYNFQRVHIPSVKRAVKLLANCKEGAVIFADGPQLAMELMYYETDCPVYFFNETLEMGGGFAMLSGSPLRVANASELPATNEILFAYYNTPKNTLPSSFVKESVTTKEKLSVAVYRATSR